MNLSTKPFNFHSKNELLEKYNLSQNTVDTQIKLKRVCVDQLTPAVFRIKLYL